MFRIKWWPVNIVLIVSLDQGSRNERHLKVLIGGAQNIGLPVELSRVARFVKLAQ